MRPIQWKDYLKVAATFGACLAFFGLVIAMEWHRADFVPKVVVVSLFALFSLLLIRVLIIYHPQDVVVSSLNIVGGPRWSATVLDMDFYWVEIERHGKTTRIRLIKEARKRKTKTA